MKAKIITSFLMLSLITSYVSAKTIYANAASGKDNNDGLSAENAVETVAQAYALADAGDVIKLSGTFLFEAQLTIEKADLTLESADTQSPAVLDGQGSYRLFQLKNSVTFRNLIFKNGFGDNGGALMLPIGFWRTVKVTGCVFDGNSSGNMGGAIYVCTYGGTDILTINRCVFKNNRSGSHGGTIAFIPEGGDPVGNRATLNVSNSTITANRNTGGVGAVLFVDGGARNWATFNFDHVTIAGNSDRDNQNGNIAGIAINSSEASVNVRNSIIEGNVSANGDFCDLSFSDIPTALTIKNSIIGHLTIWGSTINVASLPQTSLISESNVNNVKISTDQAVSGLDAFNGAYFTLLPNALAYNFGRIANLTPEINADQLGVSRTDATYTSAGSVEFFQSVTTSTASEILKPIIQTTKNQLYISPVSEQTVEIYNTMGSLVYKNKISSGQNIPLSSGMYLLRFSISPASVVKVIIP